MTSIWTWTRLSRTLAAASASTSAACRWTPRWVICGPTARDVLEALFASVPGGNPTIADVARYRAYNQQITGTPARNLAGRQRHHQPDPVRLLHGLHRRGATGATPPVPGPYRVTARHAAGETVRRRCAAAVPAPGREVPGCVFLGGVLGRASRKASEGGTAGEDGRRLLHRPCL